MTHDPSRFPIGPFDEPFPVTADHVVRWIYEIADLPGQLRAAVDALPQGGLDTPYRDGGWTARQVVHHVADSHINSYVRFKWALTEATPTIKAYDEKAWAELPDAANVGVETSLALLDALHARWTGLLTALTADDLERRFVHPESGDTIKLKTNVGIYAWHGAHHVAHVKLAGQRAAGVGA